MGTINTVSNTELLFTLYQRKGWVSQNINFKTNETTKKIVILFGPDEDIVDYLQDIFCQISSAPGLLTRNREYYKMEWKPPAEYLQLFENYGSLRKRTK